MRDAFIPEAADLELHRELSEGQRIIAAQKNSSNRVGCVHWLLQRRETELLCPSVPGYEGFGEAE